MSIETPILLEIGPGRGDFLIHLAQENPLRPIAAIEYKRRRFEKLLKRIEVYPQVTLHLGDARTVLPEKFPDASVEETYILFSDPWPKRRHARNRLFQAGFIAELARVLRPDGKILIATDDPRYRDQIEAEFQKNPAFTRLAEDPSLFPTCYAQKWVKAGRTLFAFAYRRR